MKPPLLRAAWLSRQMILLRKADKEAVRTAVMPEEAPAPTELIDSIQEIGRSNLKKSLQLTVISAGGIIGGILLRTRFEQWNIIVCTCALMLFAAVMLICRSRSEKNIRDDAAVIRIPIAGVQKKLIACYCYFYLPDGKYRFLFDQSVPQPEEILIIRSGTKLHYQLIGKDEKT